MNDFQLQKIQNEAFFEDGDNKNQQDYVPIILTSWLICKSEKQSCFESVFIRISSKHTSLTIQKL